MAVYGIEGVWVMGPLIWVILGRDRNVSGRSRFGLWRSIRSCWPGSVFLAELSEYGTGRNDPCGNSRNLCRVRCLRGLQAPSRRKQTIRRCAPHGCQYRLQRAGWLAIGVASATVAG